MCRGATTSAVIFRESSNEMESPLHHTRDKPGHDSGKRFYVIGTPALRLRSRWPSQSREGFKMRVLDVAFLGILAAAACTPAHSWSEEFRMQEVPSLPPQAAGAVAPRTILFTDHRKDELVDPITGLIHFSDWE